MKFYTEEFNKVQIFFEKLKIFWENLKNLEKLFNEMKMSARNQKFNEIKNLKKSKL